MTAATYTIGPPSPPNIRHDNGFLDKFQRRAPMLDDRKKYSFWKAKLEMAEAVQDVPFMPHNDLPDALAAYRHFLDGRGKTRYFSYDRYVQHDSSGKLTLENAIKDAELGAMELYNAKFRGKPAKFSITSSAVSAGSGSSVFPYPATENWQKAIGGHNFWMSADVAVTIVGAMPQFEMTLTLHVEDMYNFNPGQQDIATGIPDSENGIFEITGLAQQYLNVSTLMRKVKWSSSPAKPTEVTNPNRLRDRQPGDNRRLRNRL